MKRQFAIVCLFLVLLAAAPLATSYIMVSDAMLVEQADRIVSGRISAITTRLRQGSPETVYTLEVTRSLKGDAASELQFRVPGGTVGDLDWRVAGMPHFQVGQRSLLFLSANERGDWTPLHLMLGAFHDVSDGVRRLALRNLDQASEFHFDSRLDTGRYHQPRDLERFIDWIDERVEGRQVEGDYFVSAEDDEIRGMLHDFTISTGPFGNPTRWFIFDQADFENWRINDQGQPGFDAEGSDPPGTAGFQQAIAAWNNDPNSNIDYRFDGTTPITDTSNLNNFSVIVFDDPTDDISTDFMCTQNGFGGTLGVGGPFTLSQNNQFKGQTFNPNVVARVIMNVGVECLLQSNGGFFTQQVYETNIIEVFTHELGHTLGLGHSCGDSESPSCNSDPVLNDATMNALANFDGRGATIKADDQAAIAFLYGSSVGGPGSTAQFFAQVGDVLVPGFVGLQTTILLENTSGSAVTATLDFFGAGTLNGSTVEAAGPIDMPFVGLPVASSYEIDLDPGEVRVLETPGDSPPADFPLGFGRLTAPGGVTGTAVFTRTNELGIRNSKAGVPAIGLGTDASLIVDNRDTSSVGFVLVNPPANGGSTAQADANVTLRLYDEDFNLLQTVILVLEAGAHFSRFIDEVFTINVSDFLGSITITSDTPITALELLEDNPPGAFPANVAILTAFPVIPGRADQSLVAGSASLQGRRLMTRLTLPAGADVVATVYRIYDGETQLARISRGGGDGELRESFQLPGYVSTDDLRVSVQLLHSDRAPSKEHWLRN